MSALKPGTEPGKSTGTQPTQSGAPRVCNSCKARPMRYTCPKCNSPYCSRECYQAHSAQCTESFYRANVEAELKGKRASDKEQEAMRAMLEREKIARGEDETMVDRVARGESQGLDEEEDELLELAALNLDDPEWMAGLSARSLAKFHRILASGALDNVLRPWVPWWYNDRLTPSMTLISESNSDSAQEDEEDSDELSGPPTPAPSPPILANIPTIESLTKIKPSPLIINNILEILYVYAYVKKLFNGDWDEENGTDAIDAVIQLSAVLRENTVYKDLKDACRTPLEASLTSQELFVSPLYSTSVLRDLLLLVSHQAEFIKAALSELQELFLGAVASKQIYSQKSSSTTSAPALPASTPSKPMATVSQMQKKLVFMISWANQAPQDVLEAAKFGVSAVVSEYENMAPKQPAKEEKEQVLSSPGIIPDIKEKKVVKKPIIEEL